MPYEVLSINRMRIDDIYTEDKLVGITVSHDNELNTYQLGTDRQIIVPRPYFLHDLKTEKTRQVGKTDTLDLRLSSIFDMIRDKETNKLILSEYPATENFRKTAYIEFAAEDTTDKPYPTTLKFFEEANAALKDMIIRASGKEYSIRFSLFNFHSSYKDLKFHAYSQYLMLRTEEDSDIIITPQIEKFRK